MPRHLPIRRLALAPALVSGLLLAGCGSQTKTESVAETPPPTQSSTSTTPATTTSTATTTPAPTGAAGGTSAPSTTRTATEPAFTQHEAHGEGAGEAEAVLRAHGYTAADGSQYHSGQTLRVLVGSRDGAGDGYGQQAFFFVGGRFIGTDTKQPSATVRVVSQGDTEVTLAYQLYRPGDPLSSPTGGQSVVHFQLNNGELTPLNPIPPANSTKTLSRN